MASSWSALKAATRFWEPMRVPYNLLLLLLTLIFAPWGMIVEGWISFLVLALIANAFYCAAYPADLLLQNRQRAATIGSLRKWRLGLWAVGSLMAFWLAALMLLALTWGWNFDRPPAV